MMDLTQHDKFVFARHEIGFLIDAIAQMHPAISMLMQKLREAPIQAEAPVPAENPPGTAGGTASDATIHGPAP